MHVLLTVFQTIQSIFGFIYLFWLHPDQILKEFLEYSPTVFYVFLALVLLFETGCLLLAFLPGDSLLLFIGSLACEGRCSVHLVSFILLVAATAGSAINYWVGRLFGAKLFVPRAQQTWLEGWVNEARLFFEKHRAKAVFLSKNFGWVRTFVPFLAGMQRMPFDVFMLQNFLGSLFWIYSFTYAGYYLSGFAIVKRTQHYWGMIALGIPIVTLMIRSIRNFFIARSTRAQCGQLGRKVEVVKTSPCQGI